MSFLLLLTDLSSLEPVTSNDAVAAAHRQRPPEADVPLPVQMLSAHALDDMQLQRWGLVAPKGPDGDTMLAAVAPLRAWREQQMGAKAVVLRAPAGLSYDEQRAWPHKAWGRLPLHLRPRYVLILGDLHQVPLAIQQSLVASACVGRLCFTELDGSIDAAGYAAYSQKVVASERAAMSVDHPRLLFYANRDHSDDALENHYAYVVKQCRKRAERNGDAPSGHILNFGRPGDPQWDGPHAQGSAATEAATEAAIDRKSQLLHWAEQAHPSVLLALCHGAGVTDPAEQRHRQGALVLSGAHGKRVIDHSFFADRSFLPGGFWLLNACFGAGTPARSVYHPWLEKLAQLGGEAVSPAMALKYLAGAGGVHQQGALRSTVKARIKAKLKAKLHLDECAEPAARRPFIARVPQVALANPRGPLGFLGHVDIVWGYGYRNPLGGTAADSSPYYGVIQALARGARFGIAMRTLTERAGALGLELAMIDVESEPSKQLLRTQLWLQCWDLNGYILLGDPAARLPMRDGQSAAASAPAQPAQRGATRSVPMTQQQTHNLGPPPPASPGLGPDAMQDAVFRCIRGEAPSAVAADLGVSPDVLQRWYAAYTAAGMNALRKSSASDQGAG